MYKKRALIKSTLVHRQAQWGVGFCVSRRFFAVLVGFFALTFSLFAPDTVHITCDSDVGPVGRANRSAVGLMLFSFYHTMVEQLTFSGRH